MKLGYLKKDKVADLETNLKNNIDKYLTANIDIDSNNFLESNIDFTNFNLLDKEPGNLNDFENSKRLYKALKNLTPVQASDERIWVGLTHRKEGLKYVLNRWSIDENSSLGTYKDRFFGKPMRNSLSRLWWYGYTTYDEELCKENPWKLTEILTNNQDLAVGIMERGYSNNKKFVNTFLRALLEYKEEKKSLPNTEKMRKILKDIQRISAITLVDLLEVNDFKKIIEKYDI